MSFDWVTKTGRKIKFADTDDEHLVNIYRYLRRRAVGEVIALKQSPGKWRDHLIESRHVYRPDRSLLTELPFEINTGHVFLTLENEIKRRALKVEANLDETLACLYRVRSTILRSLNRPGAVQDMRDDIIKTLDAYGFMPEVEVR